MKCSKIFRDCVVQSTKGFSYYTSSLDRKGTSYCHALQGEAGSEDDEADTRPKKSFINQTA